ncbi:SH3 domain-containing protein [Chloroflexi bacterium TSY]|nr:SH3 domain-containing protein [Chloroflexi bacterium TSY]
MPTHPFAELDSCRQVNDTFVFRIGQAHDVYATQVFLEREVPRRARRFHKQTHEWHIHRDYFFVLDNLFVNFPHILFETGAGYRPTSLDSLPYVSIPHKVSSNPLQRMSLISVLVVVIGVWSCWLISNQNRLNETDVQSFQADVNDQAPSQVELPASTNPAIQDLPGVTSTETPTAIAQVGIALVIVQRLSNLRAGPGTEFAIQGQVDRGENLVSTGRYRTEEDEVWYRLANGLWIFSGQTSPPHEGLQWIEVWP